MVAIFMIEITIPAGARVFVLEDNSKRLSWFCERLPDAAFAYDANTAITRLANEQFDVLFLDHDLQPRLMDSGEEDTGYTVAKFLASEQNIHNRDCQIIVHSWNPAGAANIVNLIGGTHIPFSSFEIIRS